MTLNKLVTELKAKLETVKNICKSASQRQAKYTALSKKLSQWEKEFEANAKKTKPAKAKQPRQKKIAPVTPQWPSDSQQPLSESQQEEDQMIIVAEVTEEN